MNAELIKKALGKVQDPHVLVNLVSRRVRQFTAGARPMITETGTLGFADIALVEIIEEKMGFDMPEIVELIRPAAQNGRKPQGWVKTPALKTKLAA